MSVRFLTRFLTLLGLTVLLLTCCRPAVPGGGRWSEIEGASREAPSVSLEPGPSAAVVPGLSEDEAKTLSSIEKLHDYPLYMMRFQGSYDRGSIVDSGEVGAGREAMAAEIPPENWTCSLFAALGDPDGALYGRNFDWDYSPALLLLTEPPDGYSSVSMVDIAYLGFEPEEIEHLDTLPLEDLRPLLGAPWWPFDGMNEHGVAVGMAAVPPGGVAPDPGKEVIGSLEVIRQVLDGALTVEQALAILQSYNIDFGQGPALHYLVADRSGQSALVEFYQGEVVVSRNAQPWDLATNFVRAGVESTPEEQAPASSCWRYETMREVLAERQGRLGVQEAVDLLSRVAQANTQWSIVYELGAGGVNVAMGRDRGGLVVVDLW